MASMALVVSGECFSSGGMNSSTGSVRKLTTSLKILWCSLACILVSVAYSHLSYPFRTILLSGSFGSSCIVVVGFVMYWLILRWYASHCSDKVSVTFPYLSFTYFSFRYWSSGDRFDVMMMYGLLNSIKFPLDSTSIPVPSQILRKVSMAMQDENSSMMTTGCWSYLCHHLILGGLS